MSCHKPWSCKMRGKKVKNWPVHQMFTVLYTRQICFLTHTPSFKDHSSTHSHSHHYLLPVSSQSLTAHTLFCCLERVSVCVSFAQFGHFNMRHCLIYNRARGGCKGSLWCSCVPAHTCRGVVHEPIMCLSFHSINLSWNHLQLNALSNPASTCFVLNTHTDYWSESDSYLLSALITDQIQTDETFFPNAHYYILMWSTKGDILKNVNAALLL